MKNIARNAALFVVGGIVYALIEILWRGYTHWTMAVASGLCFLLIGFLNEDFTWDMTLLYQGVVGALIVTTVELSFGIILNVWLGLGVWDYSNMPLNVMGQICLPFTFLWIPLSIVAVIVDDWLRHWWFGEDRPHYQLF